MDITLTQQANVSDNAIYLARLALNRIHLHAGAVSLDQYLNRTPVFKKPVVMMIAAAPTADKEITMCL